MTEMVNGESQNHIPASPAQTQTDAGLPNESVERTFKQSEVNDIVGRVKHEAVERYKRSQDAERTRYQDQGYATDYLNQIHNQPVKHMEPEDVKRMAAEEVSRLMEKNQEDAIRKSQEQEANRIATEFFTKFEAAKKKYDDFDKVTADVDLQAIPGIVHIATTLDNTGDVMYELSKNPMKIGHIQSLINQGLGKLAYAEMKRLSESIKTNEEATNFKSPYPPLDKVRPSNTGTGNQGALSVSDYRAKYRV